MTDIRSQADLERLGAPAPSLRSLEDEAEVQRILAALRLSAEIVRASGREHSVEEALAVFERVRVSA